MFLSLARKFENCIDCSRYALIDREGRCTNCANRELELLQSAKQLIKTNPNMSRDELASVLHVDAARVDRWRRGGKIHCLVLSSKCPNCGKTVTKFSCTSCNYRVAEDLREQEKKRLEKELRSYEMHTRNSIRDRHKRGRRELLRSKASPLHHR